MGWGECVALESSLINTQVVGTTRHARIQKIHFRNLFIACILNSENKKRKYRRMDVYS